MCLSLQPINQQTEHYPTRMKFTINSKSLLSRLVAAGKVIPAKTVLQILNHFKFVLEGTQLTITAFGNDNAVISRIQVDSAEGEGSVCVDARRITDLLKGMPDCPVLFTVEGANVNIRYANGKYNLSGVDGSEYPLVDNLDAADIIASFSVPSSAVLSAFDKVEFAISKDELRPQMTGVLWDVHPESITFVATDTRVLAKYRTTNITPGVEAQFILPGNAIPMVRALVGKDTAVKVFLTGKGVFFTGDDYSLKLSLCKGKYPDYNRVIPMNNNNVITADRVDLLNAIQRVSVVCSDRRSPMLMFKMQDGFLDIVGTNIELNMNGEERISCSLNGSPVDIAFDANYIKNTINAIPSHKVVIRLDSQARPGLFLPSENEEHGELTLLCMPMNVCR